MKMLDVCCGMGGVSEGFAAEHCEDIQGPNRSWIRAKIPESCSRAFANACKIALIVDEMEQIYEKQPIENFSSSETKKENL